MLIQTIHGDLPEESLEKRVINEVHPDALVTVTEYWQLVHRSVHAELKPKELFSPQAQGF